MDIEEHSQIVQLVAVREIVELARTPVVTPIILDLPRWTSINSNIPNPKLGTTDLAIVRNILQYFLDVAINNSLQNSSAARKLAEALNIIDSIGPSTKLDQITVASRQAFEPEQIPLQQLQWIHVKGAINSSQQLQEACQHLVQVTKINVPIFNIWDSISVIYTLCAESVTTSLQAELHLFQFRCIVEILSKHRYLGRDTAVPSTVAATWSDPGEADGNPLLIAFATTCAASKQDKPQIASARYDFAKTVVAALKVVKQRISILANFPPGNCAEYLSIVIVCRQVGYYISLCQRTSGDVIYKMCDYCQELRDVLAQMDINILDAWKTSFLGEGDAVEQVPAFGFSFRKLMTYASIREHFGYVTGV